MLYIYATEEVPALRQSVENNPNLIFSSNSKSSTVCEDKLRLTTNNLVLDHMQCKMTPLYVTSAALMWIKSDTATKLICSD